MLIKRIYLYSVSLLTLVLFLYGAFILLDQAIEAWILPRGDQPNFSYPCMTPASAPMICDQVTIDLQRRIDEEDHAASKQRDAAQAIAMIVIAAPAFWFHWRQARKEV